jgi:hypothetical protein
MGLSNLLPGGESQGAGAADETAAPAHQDFGHRLGNYFESKYPIAGGLAQAVFGGGNQAPITQPATAPLAAMPQPSQPDYSMIAQNAQPKQGGGLAAILKLLA